MIIMNCLVNERTFPNPILEDHNENNHQRINISSLASFQRIAHIRLIVLVILYRGCSAYKKF